MPTTTAITSLRPAGRRGRRAAIAAAFGGDAGIDRPGQKRAEQQDRAEIAVRQQMRERP